MTEFFLKQLRPLLCYCNLFSITYIVFAKTKSLFLHRAELFMGAPITLFYAFCVYAYTIELMAGKALRLSLISKIADPLEFIAFVFNLIIKWTYYFFKRNETRQVVFEVAKLQTINMCKATYSHGNRCIFLLTGFSGFAFVINAAPFIYSYGTLNGVMYSSTYMIPHLISIWETLLMVKLTSAVQSTYLFTNNLIIARKLQSKCLRKVAPMRNTQNYEHREKIFTRRNINNVIESHYNATMASKRINNLFEFPILVTLAINFLSSSLTLYYILCILENIRKGHKVSPILFAVTWPLATMLAQTVAIVKSFDSVAMEARKTSKHIHELWNLLQKQHMNVDILIKLTSVQVLHTKPNFTARGWFTLDMTVVQMFVSAIATYLVILVQLERSSVEIQANNTVGANSTL